MDFDQLFPHRKDRGTLGRRTVLFAILPAGLIAAYYLHPQLIQLSGTTAIAGLIAIAAGLIYLNASQHRALRALHDGVLRAQEGELQPVHIGRIPDFITQRVAADYNLLMNNLGSMFREIEECQNRTISERNRNDAILNSLPGALLCVDSDGRVTHSNRMAEQIFSASCAELTGRNLFGILNLDEHGVVLLRDALLYERQVVNKEVGLHFGSAFRVFTLNLAPFLTPGHAGAAVVLQDITDYKRLQESAYTTEKLSAIGQLAAGVAHELNTPLGNIVGYASLLVGDGHAPEEISNYSRIISAEAKRCSRIVDNLLSYARRDQCRPGMCIVNALIADVVSTIDNCQGRRYDVKIATELAAENPQVRGENGQIEIVLVNLLMNAIQATKDSPRPARVSVRTRVDSPGSVIMEVEDNGIGVPTELRARIFDPFFTTKEVGEGTGLGLAISQMIVARLNGSIRHDASFTCGARFEVKLLRA